MPPTEEGYTGGIAFKNNSMNGPGNIGGANPQQPSQQKSNIIYFEAASLRH